MEDLGGFFKPACPNDISFFGCGSSKEVLNCTFHILGGTALHSQESRTLTCLKRGSSSQLDAVLRSKTL